MAEIPIQERKHRSMLPLIIGALVVLALLGWLLSRRNDDRTTEAATGTTVTDTLAPVTSTTPNGDANAANAGTTGTAGSTGSAGTRP